MKTFNLLRVFTVFIVMALSLGAFVVRAGAKSQAAIVGTSLTIKPLASVSVGSPAMVAIRLVSAKGAPVANQRVELLVDGVHERTAKTDASGNISVRLRRDTVGTYELSAVFKGSKQPSLGSSRASTELVVEPEIIEIRTTPSLPGVKFSLEGQVFTSGKDGIARIEVDEAGTYRLDVLPLEIKEKNIQMDFDRWGDEAFQPSREIIIPLRKPLEVGFEVSYRISETFVDLFNEPVPPERISSITYKGSTGATFTFEEPGPHWLPAGRVIRRSSGLEETKILYSVMSVMIDGTNVVSQAQQRFYVNPEDTWTIQVLLYSAHFTAQDALFGFPLGDGIRMEYPDGKMRTYSFDTAEGYTIDGLARGIYRVAVTGAGGYAPLTPIALSRDQNVELLVFSFLDIGILLVVGLLLSVGLLLYGRPHLAGQTVAWGRWAVNNRRQIIPAARAWFSRTVARVSQILSGKKRLALENAGRMPGENIRADEVAAQGRTADGASASQPKQPERTDQRNEVENLT